MSKKRHRRRTKYINSIHIEKLIIRNCSTNDVERKFERSDKRGKILEDKQYYIIAILFYLLDKLDLIRKLYDFFIG